MLSSMNPPSARRNYRSTRRAEQAAHTRADIVAAAARLFAEDGWANTTMTNVAAEASVAVETVYQRFKTKAALLQAAVDATIGGAEHPEPLEKQERFTRVGHGDPDERLAAAARLVGEINARTHALYEAWRQAAVTNPAIAAELREYETRRRTDIATGLRLLNGDSVGDRTVDAAWAVLSTDVYAKLVTARGWSRSDYQAFAQRTLKELLACDGPRTSPGTEARKP